MTTRRNDETTILDGEILTDDHPGPRDDATAEVPPEPQGAAAWIARNRHLIEQGRTLAQSAIMVAPPPVRLALAAGSVAAEGLLLADDVRTGKIARERVHLRAGGIALEGLALMATSRAAPAVLAKNAARINGLRRILRAADRTR